MRGAEKALCSDGKISARGIIELQQRPVCLEAAPTRRTLCNNFGRVQPGPTRLTRDVELDIKLEPNNALGIPQSVLQRMEGCQKMTDRRDEEPSTNSQAARI